LAISLQKSMIVSLKTRLINRILWLQKCGWFHFAHKPLCTHYETSVLRLGKLAVCRSCTLLYVFGALAFFAVSFLGLWGAAIMPAATTILIGFVSTLSYPPLYKKHPRWVCDLLRSLLGVTIALAIGRLLVSPLAPLSIFNISLLASVWLYFRKKRQQTKHDKCTSCPEFQEGTICSGYSEQAESVRQYQDIFAAYLTKTHRKYDPS